LKPKYLEDEDVVKKAFDFFDKDKDGNISIEEIKMVLKRKNADIDDDLWIELFKEVDSNDDALISFEEFQNMINLYIQERYKD
jgi:Ca2+-binding EF-hand superfamily protein